MEIPKNIAGIMMALIISDTLMFHSPTATEIDKAAASHLSEICGIEIEEFAIDMFGAGTNPAIRMLLRYSSRIIRASL